MRPFKRLANYLHGDLTRRVKEQEMHSLITKVAKDSELQLGIKM